MNNNRYFARPRNSSILGRQRHDSLYLPQRSSPIKERSEVNSPLPNDKQEVTGSNAISASSGFTLSRKWLRVTNFCKIVWIRKVGNEMLQMSSMLPCSPTRNNLTTSRTLSSINSSDEESSEDEGPQLNRKYSLPASNPSPQGSLSPRYFNDYASETGNSIRIIAPNVSKLSRNSVIEIKLNSINEIVTVLCSIDVLKMRSGFFHDVLREREENLSMSNSKNFETLREPISIPEISPYEAAAYLESLHEGRALFKGEWNMCWARLRLFSL